MLDGKSPQDLKLKKKVEVIKQYQTFGDPLELRWSNHLDLERVTELETIQK